MLITNNRLGGRVIYQISPPSYSGAKWYAFYVERVDAREVFKESKEAKS